MGQHLQLRAREMLVEVPYASALSGNHFLWNTDSGPFRSE